MQYLVFSLPLTAAILTSVPARAHTGDHNDASFLHLVTEPDHLAIILAAGALGVIALGIRYFTKKR